VTLAGTKTPAGLGLSTVIADWDVETYSEAGYVWDAATQKWKCLPGASQGKKGLPVVGAAVYFEHPTADVLLMAYDLKDGRGKRRWRPGMSVPQDWIDHILAGKPIESHGSSFEGWANRLVLVPRYGFPEIRPEQMYCSMAKARAWSLPGGLAPLGDVLNASVLKDKDGERLMKIFSMPRNPTLSNPRTRITLDELPEEAERYAKYNDRDIETEAAISRLIPDMPPFEREYWLVDQAINRRGVHIDRAGTEACISIVEQALAQYNRELAELTGGVVQRASELEKLKGWIGARGLVLGSMDEEALDYWVDRLRTATKLAEANWLDADGLDCWLAYEDVAHLVADRSILRALEIRQIVGSAAVKKVFSIRNQLTSHDRLHDLFTGHGARTGRPTGNGPQPTNLPNSGPSCYQCEDCHRWFPAPHLACTNCGQIRGPHVKLHEWNPAACEDALLDIATRSLDYVEMRWGEGMPTVSACLRGLFNAAPGKILIGSDYSAIEAVVNAMLSGEQWRIDVFRTHGKIYEASASTMYRIPLEKILEHKAITGDHHPLRKKGKVAELAFGYLGWVGAAKAFGMPGTDAEIQADILAWRDASPSIVFLGGGQKAIPELIAWHQAAIAAGGAPCEGPAWESLRVRMREARPWDGTPYLYGLEGMMIAAIQRPDKLFPVYRLDGTHSGLSMVCRHDVLYMILPSGRRIAYHHPRLRLADKSWRGMSISFEGWNTNPKMGPPGWVTLYTYAGKVLENACQAVANDVLRFGQVNLERAGYPLVLHVYDENVAEVPEDFGSVEHFESVMNTMPPWAHDWPIRATGGWRGPRFRK
jgi:DNA polymerase